jgi:DNA polymerase
MLPLSNETRSGALIEQIEIPLRRNVTFYKTNLVKCLPLKGDKIRYPLRKEMEKCSSNFEDELDMFRPLVVFLLGKQVASFVLKKFSKQEFTLSKSFKYEQFTIGNITFIPVHHPSYILVYKRKNVDEYIGNIQRICVRILENKGVV